MIPLVTYGYLLSLRAAHHSHQWYLQPITIPTNDYEKDHLAAVIGVGCRVPNSRYTAYAVP